MKNVLLWIAVGICFSFWGCQTDAAPEKQSNFSHKQWKLIQVQGGFAGFNDEFEPGVITWTFNNITNTITVVNNNNDPTLHDVLPTGIYNFHVDLSANPVQCDQALFIDDTEMGCVQITEDNLIVSQLYADGMQLIFTR